MSKIDNYIFKDCLNKIKDINENNEERIKQLEEENKKLKEDHYKDEEIQKLQQKLEKLQKMYRNGFPITEEERENIEKWQKKHDEEAHGITTLDQRLRSAGCIGGKYTYEFILTSIGVIGMVKCSCGEKFTFAEL